MCIVVPKNNIKTLGPDKSENEQISYQILNCRELAALSTGMSIIVYGNV